MNQLNKIVIVGGGSAGWMSAVTLKESFPHREIVVIESPDVPTVGVGESTPQTIRSWTTFVGLDDKDFMKHADATYKLSIKFNDFYKKGSGGFHYPFGRVHYPYDSDMGLNLWHIIRNYYPNIPTEDYAKTFYPQMAFVDKSKIDDNVDGIFGEFLLHRDSAYHFDATKFAIWLRDGVCIPRGVKHIQALVKLVKTNSDGIESLVLDDGSLVEGDLYIDCTGFKSLLLGDALGEKFISFNNQLPNNRAWATKLNYDDKESEMHPYTTCTAIDHGWVWNIPCWNRIGTGYVYSDKYISPEESLLEFKDHLKETGKYSDDLEYKDIPFRVGIHERTWVKNVVAIGLSAGFMEPLESNGLLTIYEFLLKLIKVINRDYYSNYDREIYNIANFTFFSNFADFVSSHYIFNQRRDNDYWVDISKMSFIDHPTLMDFGERKLVRHNLKDTDGYHAISAGLNYNVVDKSFIKDLELQRGINLKEYVDIILPRISEIRSLLDTTSERSLSHFEYLKRNIYVETMV